jgi:hypothetical protein
MKRVAVALHGSHEARRPGVVVNGVANLGDEHRQVGVRDEGVRPEVRVQFRLRERAWPRAQQRCQQIERFVRQVHLALASQQLPGLLVDREGIEAEPHRPATQGYRNYGFLIDFFEFL